ncbi:MAG TPA: MBOAT family protein [Thermoanaerobaculia bacterium]
MSAYTPSDLLTVLEVAGLLVAIFVIGFGIARLLPARGRLAAWTLAFAAVTISSRLSTKEPAGVRMVAIVLALLYAMKAVAAVEARARGEAPLSFVAWICFAAGWFGMRPSLFHTVGSRPLPGSMTLIRAGITRIIAGAILVVASWFVWRSPLSAGHETGFRYLLTVPLMAGLSLMLHFGLFNVVRGAWRALGVDAEPLFQSPHVSKTLAEFWSRRWNAGYSEMTSLAVFHPLRRKVGAPLAVMLSFGFSGVLHDIAISLPVKDGFGLPLLYFLIQGASMLAQRRVGGSRLWTLVTLILPLPLLFHTPFLNGVVWPLIGMGR